MGASFRVPVLDSLIFNRFAAQMGGRVRFMITGMQMLFSHLLFYSPVHIRIHTYVYLLTHSCVPVLDWLILLQSLRRTDGQLYALCDIYLYTHETFNAAATYSTSTPIFTLLIVSFSNHRRRCAQSRHAQILTCGPMRAHRPRLRTHRDLWHVFGHAV